MWLQTPEFTAGLNTDYLLYIESEHRIDFDRLDSLLGLAGARPTRTGANVPDAIDIDWKVLHAGKVMATGSSLNFQGEFYSDTVAREIGHFSARKGSGTLSPWTFTGTVANSPKRIRSYWFGPIPMRGRASPFVS